jgi:ecotin
MFKAGLLPLLSILLAASAGWAGDPMQAFPAAESGMVRHTLRVPPLKDESAARIELMAGRTVAVDERNTYFFGGRITEETIEGWGYPRYVVSTLGPMAGTRMAIDPKAPKVPRFIQLAGEPYLIRYNSRLPLVVYAPTDVEIRYRIWNAGTEIKAMDPG